MDIINKNKSVMELFGEMVEQASLNLHTQIISIDPFTQQENDEVQAKLFATISDLVKNDENLTDEATICEESSSLLASTVLVLMP